MHANAKKIISAFDVIQGGVVTVKNLDGYAPDGHFILIKEIFRRQEVMRGYGFTDLHVKK